MQDILSVLEKLARRGVERQRDLLAGRVAGLLDGRQDDLDRLRVRLQAGREAPLVAHGRVVTFTGEHLLQCVEGLGAHSQGFTEVGRTQGHDHELLKIHVVVGVPAAIEHVHHRHGDRRGIDPAQVLVERQSCGGSGRLGHRDGNAEDGVGPQALLERGAVLVDHHPIDVSLLAGILTAQERGQHMLDVADRVQDTLAAKAGLVAVAQFAGLAAARRGSGGDGGPT